MSIDNVYQRFTSKQQSLPLLAGHTRDNFGSKRTEKGKKGSKKKLDTYSNVRNRNNEHLLTCVRLHENPSCVPLIISISEPLLPKNNQRILNQLRLVEIFSISFPFQP